MDQGAPEAPPLGKSCLGSEGGAGGLGRALLGIHPHFRQVIFARVGARLEGLGGERGVCQKVISFMQVQRTRSQKGDRRRIGGSTQ